MPESGLILTHFPFHINRCEIAIADEVEHDES